MKLKVSNLHNNQYVIEIGDDIYFQSYKTLVAKVDKNKNIILSSYWDYSITTLKYLKQFLCKYTKYCLKNKKAFIHFIELGIFEVIKELEYEC